MLWHSGRADSRPQGAARIAKALDDGSALSTFQAMLQAQGVAADVARALCAGTEEERRRVLGWACAQEELMTQSDGKEGLGLGQHLTVLPVSRQQWGAMQGHPFG